MDFLLIFMQEKKLNKMRRSNFCLFLLLISLHALAQKDTVTLQVEQVLGMVKLYHPIVKQGYINIDKSKANITISQGAFNPILGNYMTKKIVDNAQYYDYINPTIVIPTWYGVEISAGTETLSGNRYDPSESLGQSSYIGASIPLLKNLVMDKRRANLQQAKLFNDMAKTEQQSLINTILMDAASAYWDWVNSYQIYLISQKSLALSSKRLDMVRKAFMNGDYTAMDTVEAQSQLQNFEFQKNESWLKYQLASIELSAFLWQEDDTPYQLPAYVVPDYGWDKEDNIMTFILDEEELLQLAQQAHPDLVIYQTKLNSLEIDKKLKFQELLPKLDFRYNHLSKGYNAFNNGISLFQNNYQYALKLEMPILFSQGRGEYKIAKLKIKENQFMQNQKARTIVLKVKSYFNEYQTLRKQIALQRSMIDNVERLLKAEETLFANGESALFIINSRENKVFEAERKLSELKTKYVKTIYALQWSAGLLR